MARSASERALALDPDLPDAHFATGLRQFRIEWNFEEAESNFRRAGSAAHEIPFLNWVWAEMLLGLRRYEDARREIRLALEINPYNTAIMVGDAHLHMIEGRELEAEAILERGVGIGPEDAWIRAKLGVLRCWQSRYEQGLEHLERAYRETPTDPFIIGDLGWCYGRAGRRGEAVALADELEARAAEAMVYVDPGTQAAIALGLDDLERMYEHLDRAVEIHATSLTFMIPFDYRFLALSDEPRFRSVLERVGLPN